MLALCYGAGGWGRRAGHDWNSDVPDCTADAAVRIPRCFHLWWHCHDFWSPLRRYSDFCLYALPDPVDHGELDPDGGSPLHLYGDHVAEDGAGGAAAGVYGQAIWQGLWRVGNLNHTGWNSTGRIDRCSGGQCGGDGGDIPSGDAQVPL